MFRNAGSLDFVRLVPHFARDDDSVSDDNFERDDNSARDDIHEVVMRVMCRGVTLSFHRNLIFVAACYPKLTACV